MTDDFLHVCDCPDCAPDDVGACRFEAEVEALRAQLYHWRYCRECGYRGDDLKPDECPACGVIAEST